ncbi:tandem-95 repeat protein [Saccharophagus degradans]|uniref:Tandem-95 repeat protein n=1 Tax=Saccharophagus degradans TaxID=86304 RepID=A0AAW7XAA1_9GAMM|nr:tandem-95 repeat protein [Saccharophagus degradans]MDO6424424.1 tandem-95 repeat protein [Saccharophagus degradans]MDO6608369.1 tandem-95 repeat protein [Saccharophagus degradans]
MNKHLFNGIASAMVSLGVCTNSVPVQAYGSYVNRSYNRHPLGAITSKSVGLQAPSLEKIPHLENTASAASHSVVKPLLVGDLELKPLKNKALALKKASVEMQAAKQGSGPELTLKIVKSAPIQSLVIVDQRVPNKAELYNGLKPGVELVEFNSTESGLLQLKNTLSQYKNLNALHIVSHGDDGVLLLGSSEVTESVLQQEIDTLAAIDSALQDNADVLIYGCNVAKTQKGEALLALISNEANVDVAASNNVSSGNAQKGDWVLEIKKGSIDTTLAFSETALAQFNDVLAINDGTGRTIDTSGFSAGYAATKSYDVDGSGYIIQLSTNSGSGLSLYSGIGYAYANLTGGVAGLTSLYIEFSGGQQFDIDSMRIYAGGGTANYVFTPDVGSPATLSILGSGTTATLNFTDITKLTVTRQDGGDLQATPFTNLVIKNAGPITDSDGTLTSAAGVTEPVGLDTAVDSIGEAVNVFDFTLTDGGTADSSAMTVSQIVVNVSGTSTDTQRANVTWRLNGNDVSNVTGVYNAASDTITFSGLSISVADGASEVYTVNAYFNDNTNITEDTTFILSVDGDTDVTVGGSGTQMAATSAVTNGAGGTFDVVATALAFTTQPAGSVSGSALSTQPVITAQDAFGNTDVDFAETITLTEASAGSLSNNTVAASAGVATFSNVIYTATADQQSFTLTADDQSGVGTDLPTVDSNSVASDVVATTLVFSTQPIPLTVNSGVATSFSTVPVVAAQDGNGVIDTGYSTSIAIAEVNGAGSAAMSGTGDEDGNSATITLSPASGVATYTGMQITYTASGGSSETFNLQATSGGLTAATSSQLTGLVPDSDGSLVAAGGVAEPINLSYSVDTVGEAIDLFDFTLTDGGSSDGLAMNVSQIVLNVSGTATDTERGKITWRLNGNDTSNVTGVYSAVSDTITFSSLSISVVDGGSETYTVNGYYNDNTGLTHGNTVILSVDGDTDVTVSSGTQMGATSAINNSAGTQLNDDISPTVSSVSVPPNATYITGQNLDFTVNFDENITVNTGGGTPRLTLTVGADTRYANYIAGSGTSALIFRHIISSDDEDTDGIAVAGTIDTNLGTLRDGAGNDINTTLNSVGSLTGVLIDSVAPTLAEVTAVTTPTGDSTPSVTFSTTEAGTLAIGGSCGSASEGAVTSGNNTISLTQTDNSSALAAGTYSDCTATVTDAAGNTSSALTLTSFTIDLTAPTVAEVTAVTTPANDSTPDVTISTTEAGTLAVGGSCGSASEGAITSGNTTITLTQADNSTALAAGTYSDCTITVTDVSGNANTPVTLTSFTVDLTAPTVAEVTAVTTPGNDTTPNVTISTDEAGTLAVGGSCGSASEGAISSGNSTIALTQADNSSPLTAGTYADCTITVTDASGNVNTALTLTSFDIDLTAPTLAEVTAVTTPANDSTPSVTFSTTEAGTLAVGGSCGSASEGAVTSGNNTISLTQTDNSTALAAGTYSDCTATVTDAAGNTSSALTLTSFTIDLTAPTVAEVTAVTTPANDSTPDVTISTTEAGTLAVGGSCGSASEGAITSGNTTITLTQADNSTALAAGTYSDCTITVTDASGNANTPVTLTSFTVDLTAPTVAEVTAVTTPGNDTTPNVTISTDEAGILAVGGSCGSASEGAISSGNSTIALTQVDNSSPLTAGTYSDCTITVTDASGNVNTALTLTSFDIDLTAPTLAEVTAVTTPTNDATPSVTFSTTEAGTLVIGGSCGSASEGALTSGNNTISLTQTDNSTALVDATYSNCTATVTDAAGNTSSALALTSFVVDTTAATVAEVTAVVTPANDTTPDVTISTTEAGTLVLGGSCGSASAGSIASGNTTLALTQADNTSPLAAGTYSDCTVAVTDSSGNVSNTVTLTAFTIDLAAPTLAEVTAVATPGNNGMPTVTFSSTEAGTLSVGGSCGSGDEGAITSGNNTITLTQPDNSSALMSNSYSDCTLTVVDASSNASNVLTLSTFVVDVSAPTLDTNSSISVNEGETDAVIGATNLVATDNLSTAANVTYTVAAAPANGILRLSGSALANSGTFTQDDIANNRLTYDHDGGETTSDSFTFSLADGLSNVNNNSSANFSFAISVAAQNDAPQTTDDAETTDEDNAVMVDVLANDADSDDAINAASVTIVSAPSDGSTSINTATGVITYTPTANFNGADSFTYTVQDATGATSAAATVAITVNAINDVPVAVGDVTSTNINTAVSINVIANDTDVDTADAPDASTLVVVGNASNGSAVVSAGQIVYTPANGFIGNDSFTYTVNDNNGATSNTATVTVTVIDPNVVPVASNDTATTDEDTAVEVNVLANDSDGDGSLVASSVAVATAPSNGSTSVNVTTGAITYTPSANFNGSDSFTYTVEDNLGAASAAATVTITVASVNDAPVAADDTVSLLEDASLMINVLGNDSDVDGTLAVNSVAVISGPASGFVAVDPASGSVTYTPLDDYAGNDSFTYQVNDNDGAASNIATVTLTIDPVNDAPLANNDSADVVIGVDKIINVLVNDDDIDGTLEPASIVVTQQPVQGTLMNIYDGTLIYTANQTVDVSSGDSFSYTVQDNSGAESNVANVQIQFVPAAAPVVSGTPDADVEEDGSYSFTPDVTVGDSNFNLTYSVTNAPSWLSVNPVTGALTGEPGANDVGVFNNIQLNVTDGVNTVALPAFNLTVVARVDSDSDTITDYQEGKDGTDPMDGSDYLDITPPQITAPSNIILDAVALFTNVTTAQLLGLAADADTAEIDAAMAALVSDNVDGQGCCDLYPKGAIVDSYKLAPGENNIVWQATDNKNNVAEVTQKVYIRPLVSLSKDTTNVEGGVAKIGIVLNGKAPFYPLQIPYIIDVASTATSDDHDLVAGIATFNSGATSVQLTVNITADGIAENDEQLIVRLDDRTTNAQDLTNGFEADIYDINAGARTVHTLTIVERNIAPQVALVAKQNGVATLLVSPNGGPVTVSSTVVDANVGDTHTYSWATRRGNLVDTDGDTSNSSFVFSPSGLANGAYKLSLTVTDSGGAVDTETINVVVVPAPPVLSAAVDTDNDGIDDETEGTADTDGDGISDYLDNIDAPNVLPETVSETDSFLIECDPGVRCRLGQFALAGRSGGARLDKQDIAQQEDLIEDTDFELQSDLFDFEVADLPSVGQSVSVVIPQQMAIPANGVYRKFNNGVWSTFVEDANNSLHSAAGELGYCPPPGDASWQTGLIQGSYCVQLTIEDGGPNDADGLVNGSVEDPGGIAVQNSQSVSTRGSGGGSLAPVLVVLLGGLAWANRKKRAVSTRNKSKNNANKNIAASVAAAVALSLPSENAQALDWQNIVQNSFGEVSISRASGSHNKSDFVKGMAADGLVVTPTKYDTASTAFHFMLGYNYNEHLAATVGYLDLGKIAVDFDVPSGNSSALPTALKNNYPHTGSGLTLGARYTAQLMQPLMGYAELGAFVWQGEVVSVEGIADTELEGSVDPYFALGASLPLNKDAQIGIKYQYHTLDGQSVSLTGVMVKINF